MSLSLVRRLSVAAAAAMLLLAGPDFAAPGRLAWTDADIGSPPAPGRHAGSGPAITLTGSGAGAASSGDQLHFVHAPATGDVEIVARLVSLVGPPGSQAGLMLRQHDSPASPVAAVLFETPLLSPKSPETPRSTIRQLGRDPAAPYGSHAQGFTTPLAPPLWLKLVRVGKDYAVYKSVDGRLWSQVHNDTGGAFTPDGAVEAGLFVSGGPGGKPATATFDHLSIGRPHLAYRSSWVGNTYSQDSVGYVSNTIGSLYVAPDGTCYANSYYDEAGEGAKIYKNGKIVKAFDNPPGGNDLCYEGTITGDGRYVYLFSGQGGIFRTDRMGTARSARQLQFVTPVANAHKESTIRGLAAGNGELYVSDASGNQILVASLRTLKQIPSRSFPFTRPGPLAVDRRGDLWVTQCATGYPREHSTVKYPAAIKCYHRDGTFTGRQIKDVVDPYSIAIDPANDRLLVCENGPDQNVRIYTHLDTAPRCTATFGAKGGIWSGSHSGRVYDPRDGGYARFYQLTGVGADAKGNLYVSSGGSGTDLREFTPSGRLAWMLNSLHFVDCGDFDPDSDGREVYTPFKHYAMDYSRTAPGSEWKYEAYNWNWLRFGTPPRGNSSSAVVRRLGPKRRLILYTSGQGSAPPLLAFRMDGETAIPCGRITQVGGDCEMWIDRNGDGLETPDEVSRVNAPPGTGFQSFDVDSRGDVWMVWMSDSSPVIRHFRFKGLDAKGVPLYGQAPGDYEDIPFPKPVIGSWGGSARIVYDAPTDAMYLMGPVKPRHREGEDPIDVLARYDHWSKGNRTARFAVQLPDPDTDPNFMYATRPFPYNLDFTYMAMDVAGDRVFVAELWGPIHVYDARTGKLDTILNAGPEVSGLTAWEDENMGIRAVRRSNGEYVILEENSGFRGRDNLYRWKPARRSDRRAAPGTGPSTAAHLRSRDG